MSKKPMWFNLYGNLNLKNCDEVEKYGFYLPNHQDLLEDDIKKICNIVNNV